MKRIYSFILCLGAFSGLWSQPVSILESKKALENKKYKKALKIAESGLEKDKKLIELHYIKAWAELELALPIKELKEQQKAYRGVLKSLEKAQQKDPQSEYRNAYGFVYRKFTNEYKKEGVDMHYRMQYTKALPYLENAWEMSKDTHAYALMGLCYYGNKDFSKAIPVLHDAAQMMYGSWERISQEIGEKPMEIKQIPKQHDFFNLEIFQVLGKHYSEKNEEDSSLIYLEMGLDIYPGDLKLTRNITAVIDRKIRKLQGEMGLNSEMKRWLDLGLGYQPNNVFFLTSQNSYYLARLGYVLKRGDSIEAIKFDSAFWTDKQVLWNSGTRSSEDPFLTNDSLTFLSICLQHFMANDNHPALVHYFYRWYPLQYKTKGISESALQSILGNPPDFVSQRLLYAVANDAVKRFPQSSTLKDIRFGLYKKWLRSSIGPNSWNYLFAWNNLMVNEFPKKKAEIMADRQLLYERGIDSFLHYGDMPTAWKFFHLLSEDFSQTSKLDSFKKRIAIRDFEIRYKGSKIDANKKGNPLPANTGWTGISKRCIAGQMPDSTQGKVVDRVNYFRQNAGIKKELKMDENRRRKCQEASIMYAPVGVFTRVPTPETHICYTQRAAEAAAYAQVVKDANPSITATVLMSDLKSEELFNRQYILAPNAKSLGFGSSENNTVFWMVEPKDVMSKEDSAYYQKRFIAWPPAGYCPRMFFFKKWSISAPVNFEGVEVFIESKSIGKLACKTKIDQAPMLPYKTLVFEPDIAPEFTKVLQDGEVIQITINQKGKTLFSYKTILFDSN